MKNSRYYYKGIPLTIYCRDNNINTSTIFARICKLKKNKNYSSYSEQEIVNHVIEAYGSNIKYTYKGIPLRKYCIDNNLNYPTIRERIKRLQENNNLSNEEAVIKAIEEFNNSNYKYFYKGIPLKDYCIKNNINYDSIRSFINNRKNCDISDEELIEQYLNKKHTGIYKYYYKEIPLKQYCEDNNISYKAIIAFIKRNKDKDEYKNLDNDSFINLIMDNYHASQIKYTYKNQSLYTYCSNNNISYYSIVSFVKRSLKKESTKSIDELISDAINTINIHGIIYYYKGIPLKDYASDHNLNANSIRCSILRRQLKSNKSLQEIVDECVETYQAFEIKYYYNNVPLTAFCRENNINYNTIIYKYLTEYKDKKDISIDDAIRIIVDEYLANPRKRTKYYFDNQSLSSYCSDNDYSYPAIYQRMKNKNNIDIEQNIAQSIKEYEDRVHIKQINELFLKLRDNFQLVDDGIRSICKSLKINYNNVIDLIGMDFNYNQAINMIWYFSDKIDSNDNKIISDNRIKYLFKLIEDIKNNKLDSISLYELIGIFKSELYDTRNDILIKQDRYIYKVIYSLCSEYNIKINKTNLEEFISEIKYYLLLVINRTSLNNEGQIINYMNSTVKGYFRTYLKDYIKNTYYTPLDLNGNKLIRDKK